MIKKVVLLLMAISIILTGCITDKVLDPEDDTDIGEIVESTDYDLVVEMSNYSNSDELKEKLLMATGVELKNIDNQSIGILEEKEDIENLVGTIFTYNVSDELKGSQNGQPIGPINFYFSDSVDIYGLVNSQYIYIEGYYFDINNRILKALQNDFKRNISNAPVGTE